MKKQRVVVVTGGGSGMGRSIARRFANNGDIVYVLGRRLKMLQETAQKHPTIQCIEADLTDVKSVEQACQQIIKSHPQIDVLVNNAGGTAAIDPADSLANAFKTWQSMINTNLTTAFLITHNLKKHLIQPGGRILFISSIAAFSGSSRPGGEGYAASKAALHGLMRTLVRELAPNGVTVNAIAPGFVADTEFFDQDIPMEERSKRAATIIPAGRVGQPGEVAAAVFYLASDEASFINGDILNINGGQQFAR